MVKITHSEFVQLLGILMLSITKCVPGVTRRVAVGLGAFVKVAVGCVGVAV